MRNLITSLKNHNEQLKGEIQRYKKKLKDSVADVNKVVYMLYTAQLAKYSNYRIFLVFCAFPVAQRAGANGEGARGYASEEGRAGKCRTENVRARNEQRKDPAETSAPMPPDALLYSD